MLAATTLVASLLAVAASPVGAGTDKADYTAKTEACVGGALGDQMFTDVSDEHAFKDAINCIAYYGVTNGTGDGSTYSPNQDVTRAEMAVFIARAAGVAGVDLGDAMGDEFDDLDGVWQEARDAINQLADNGMIASGGDFRPGDAVTRAEMASFLVGFLVEASPIVAIDSDGAIQLGVSGSAMEADDHFADARASVPVANDKQISAIYELGITKGASAAAVQDNDKPPLDFNYEPSGTVDRGQMAAFITRALAHTSARPEGVSAQYDGSDVVVSARDENFAPRPNVVVDLFRIDAAGVDLAFDRDGGCGDVVKLGLDADGTGAGIGSFVCVIDGGDLITGGDGDTTASLGDAGIDMGGTVVWAWTGDNEDTVDDDTDLYRLDIDESEETSTADRVHVGTEFAGLKAHLGSSVLYTVQLQDADGNVTVGTDGDDPAEFLVVLTTTALLRNPLDTDAIIPNPQGASLVTTLPLTTDGDGKATFSVSAPPDPDPVDKRDKYSVAITIQPRLPDGNAPAATAFYIADSETAAAPGGTGLVTVATVTFSTEASTSHTGSVTIDTAEYVAASARGAGNRATVSVKDQYGDPIAGARVTLTTDIADLVIGSGRALAVGRDGSYTFGYEREGAAAATENLTATWVYDPDPDGDPDTNDAASRTGTATVEWAAEVTATGDGGPADINEFDLETNTIFVGGAGAGQVIRYDSNDRFDIDPDGTGTGSEAPAASSYAAFERSISDSDTLSWNRTGSSRRATNTYTLNKG